MTDLRDPLDLAEDFVERCLALWMRHEQPVAALATAMATKGLQLAAFQDGPEATAEGLERMAATIRLQFADLDTTRPN